MQDNYKVYDSIEESWRNNSLDGLFLSEGSLFSHYLSNQDSLLEAGSDGGRILFNIERDYTWYPPLVGFDFVEKSVEQARKTAEELGSNCKFFHADACNLSLFADNSFGYLLYLQQFLSFLPEKKIDLALAEAYRVAKPGACFLLNVLNFNSRPLLNSILGGLLTIVSAFRGEDRHPHSLAWLKHNGKLNKRFFAKDAAATFWFTESDLKERLEKAGFVIAHIHTEMELENNPMRKSPGHLYVHCYKPL